MIALLVTSLLISHAFAEAASKVEVDFSNLNEAASSGRVKRDSNRLIELISFNNDEIDFFVGEHNRYRRARSASDMRLMKWNRTLEEFASSHVRNCEFEHTNSPYGENLYASFTPGAMISRSAAQRAPGAWHDEIQYYSYNRNTCTNVCGHYTQMVWASSDQLGCSAAICESSNEQYNVEIIVSCNYNPPGNIIGSRPYRVRGAPCTMCEFNTDICNDGLCERVLPTTTSSSPPSTTTSSTTSSTTNRSISLSTSKKSTPFSSTTRSTPSSTTTRLTSPLTTTISTPSSSSTRFTRPSITSRSTRSSSTTRFIRPSTTSRSTRSSSTTRFIRPSTTSRSTRSSSTTQFIRPSTTSRSTPGSTTTTSTLPPPTTSFTSGPIFSTSPPTLNCGKAFEKWRESYYQWETEFEKYRIRYGSFSGNKNNSNNRRD